MTRRALTLAFVLVLEAAPLPGQGLFRRGDSSVDGRLDLSDPIATLFSLFAGGPAPCRDAQDFNDDGRLDVADAAAPLGYLFQGGPEPPPPWPCPGPDPSADLLDCREGEPPPTGQPAVSFWAEPAPFPGERTRRGLALPLPGGAFQVPVGVSFVLVVEASADPFTRSPVALADPQVPSRGNASALEVVCDRDLGDPELGGSSAGEALAPLFLGDLDLWSDPVLLVQRAPLRIDGAGPLAPAPGRYRFRARVTDTACGRSPEAELELEVEVSPAPEVHLWLEEDKGGFPSGTALAASAATGGLAAPPSGAFHLVAAGLPGGKGGPLAEVDPAALAFFADPPILLGTEAGTDLGPRFSPRGMSGQARLWSLRVDPGEGFPLKGNTRLRPEVRALDGSASRDPGRVLEREVSHARDIHPLWVRECTGCHERPQLEKGLELVGPPSARVHRNTVHVYAAEPAIDSTAPLLIRPYRPGESYLVHKLEGTHLGPPVLGSGERMPLGGPLYLGAEDLRLVRDWVLQGARNN